MIKKITVLLLFGFLSFSTTLKAQENAFEELQKELQTAKHDTSRVKILLALSNQCEVEKILKYAEPCLKLAKTNYALSKSKALRIFYLRHQADALNNIGYLATQQGDIPIAMDNYQQSLLIQEKIDDKRGLASTLSNIAFIYENQGDILNALEYYHKALKIREIINEKEGIANCLNNIGYIYNFQGDIPKAIEYHKRSLKIQEEIKNKKGIANSLHNIGIIYSNKGDITLALDYFNRCLKIREEIHNKEGITNCLNNIGGIYFLQGDSQKAIEYYNRALKIQNEQKDKEGIAESLNKIAEALLKQGQLSKALEFGNRSLKIAKELGYPDDIESAANNLKNIYLKQNKHKDAFKMYELENKMHDSIVNESTKKASITKQIQYQYETKAAADSVKNTEEQKVKNAQLSAQQAQLKQEKSQRYSLYGGLILVITFSIFVLNRFKITHRQKVIIEKQKEEVDKQRQLADSRRILAEEQNKCIERQKEIVEEHQKEILDSITYAKRLQDAILPPISFIKENISDHFILYKPKDIVAGDFYWAEKVDDFFFIAAADCTGHGVPGAMVSMVCSNALNRTVNEFGITDTGKILDNVRELVLDVFKKSGENINDGMDISLIRVDKENNEIQWSGANNPLWFIQNNELKEVKADKQHIGKTDNSVPFTSHQMTYSKDNTTYYLFTDGLADQFGGPLGKKFKLKQFSDLLIQNNHLNLQSQSVIFEKTFMDWKGQLDQIDDVCVIGIRI